MEPGLDVLDAIDARNTLSTHRTSMLRGKHTFSGTRVLCIDARATSIDDIDWVDEAIDEVLDQMPWVKSVFTKF